MLYTAIIKVIIFVFRIIYEYFQEIMLFKMWFFCIITEYYLAYKKIVKKV